MNWWDIVRQAGETLLVHHAAPAAFVFLLVEESGVPIPIPGDFLMLTLGVRARDGAVSLWQVIVAMEAGTVLGASLLYLAARRGGRGVEGSWIALAASWGSTRTASTASSAACSGVARSPCCSGGCCPA